MTHWQREQKDAKPDAQKDTETQGKNIKRNTDTHKERKKTHRHTDR